MSDTWERVQLASARVPFRLKVAAVWVVLFGLLAFLGNAAGFDTQWIRDNFRYILGGLRYTMVMALGGIVLAIVLALLGALARISRNPVAYGVAGFYVSFFRGTPLIVQMYLLYLALPQIGRNLVDSYPGLVMVYLDAWGHSGPWARRRGFDSVVQAPTGIAVGESADGETPGALPCQLLDHGTGYLAAAAALDGLRRQRTDGGTHVRRLSLARTAAWLTTAGAHHTPNEFVEDTDPPRWLQEIDAPAARVIAVRPPGANGGVVRDWPNRISGYGDDPPTWGA